MRTLSIVPATALAVALTLTAVAAQAKPHLRDVAEVDDGLLAIGLADEIRKTCPDISARMIKAYRFINDIRNRARALGYSEAEIDAYRKSDAEKARLKAEGKAYLTANGVVEGQPETYCALGRMEIQKSSQIGALLKVK